jgi:putative transposase
MCRVLEVSKAGYYAWRDRTPSRRAKVDADLLVKIQAAHRASRGCYGSPRIHAELVSSGTGCGRKRVARIMRKNGIVGKKRRQFRVSTTDSSHSDPIAPNIVARSFSPAQNAPDRAWVGDITYIPTFEGWLYLAVVIDLHTRKVVGWAMDQTLDAKIVIDALRMAIAHRRPMPGAIFHSDRGSQYACRDFRTLLAKNHLTPSMSRKGDCWDNAVAESFFATLKLELVDGARFRTRAIARSSIFEYIEVWYNRQRRHSTLGNVSPAVFERDSQAA